MFEKSQGCNDGWYYLDKDGQYRKAQDGKLSRWCGSGNSGEQLPRKKADRWEALCDASLLLRREALLVESLCADFHYSRHTS